MNLKSLTSEIKEIILTNDLSIYDTDIMEKIQQFYKSNRRGGFMDSTTIARIKDIIADQIDMEIKGEDPTSFIDSQSKDSIGKEIKNQFDKWSNQGVFPDEKILMDLSTSLIARYSKGIGQDEQNLIAQEVDRSCREQFIEFNEAQIDIAIEELDSPEFKVALQDAKSAHKRLVEDGTLKTVNGEFIINERYLKEINNTVAQYKNNNPSTSHIKTALILNSILCPDDATPEEIIGITHAMLSTPSPLISAALYNKSFPQGEVAIEVNLILKLRDGLKQIASGKTLASLVAMNQLSSSNAVSIKSVTDFLGEVVSMESLEKLLRFPRQIGCGGSGIFGRPCTTTTIATTSTSIPSTLATSTIADSTTVASTLGKFDTSTIASSIADSTTVASTLGKLATSTIADSTTVASTLGKLATSTIVSAKEDATTAVSTLANAASTLAELATSTIASSIADSTTVASTLGKFDTSTIASSIADSTTVASTLGKLATSTIADSTTVASTLGKLATSTIVSAKEDATTAVSTLANAASTLAELATSTIASSIADSTTVASTLGKFDTSTIASSIADSTTVASTLAELATSTIVSAKEATTTAVSTLANAASTLANVASTFAEIATSTIASSIADSTTVASTLGNDVASTLSKLATSSIADSTTVASTLGNAASTLANAVSAFAKLTTSAITSATTSATTSSTKLAITSASTLYTLANTLSTMATAVITSPTANTAITSATNLATFATNAVTTAATTLSTALTSLGITAIGSTHGTTAGSTHGTTTTAGTGLSNGAIAGIVVISVVPPVLICIACSVIYRKRRERKILNDQIDLGNESPVTTRSSRLSSISPSFMPTLSEYSDQSSSYQESIIHERSITKRRSPYETTRDNFSNSDTLTAGVFYNANPQNATVSKASKNRLNTAQTDPLDIEMEIITANPAPNFRSRNQPTTNQLLVDTGVSTDHAVYNEGSNKRPKTGPGY